MNRKYIPVACLIVIWVIGTRCDLAGDHDGESTQFWARYQYQRRINERLRGFGMLRYEERLDSNRVFGASNRLVTTGGVSYDASKRIRLEGGLGLYYTYLPEQTDGFETRLWQAATFDWPDSPGLVRRYVLHHRFMLEERFKKVAGWDVSLRLRYRLAFSIPINRYTVEPGAFYAPLAAEFFAPIGGDTPELFSSRQRFSVGLGYVVNKTWAVDLRYTRQRSRDTITEDYSTTDNIVDFRLKTSVRIRDLVKSR